MRSCALSVLSVLSVECGVECRQQRLGAMADAAGIDPGVMERAGLRAGTVLARH